MKQTSFGLNGPSKTLPPISTLEAAGRETLRRSIEAHPRWPHHRAAIETLSDEDLIEIAGRLHIDLHNPDQIDVFSQVVSEEAYRSIASYIKEGRLRFTPEQAQQVLDCCNYARQRDLDPTHAEVISVCMRNHLWLAGSQIAFALYQGRLHLVNGYHRLNGQIRCGRSIEYQIIIHPCLSEEELKSIYWRFDSIVRVRTRDQIVKSADVAEEQKISQRMAKTTLAVTSFILAGYKVPNAHSKNAAERRIFDISYEQSQALWPAARVFDGLIKKTRGPLKQKLLLGSVATVALSTLRYQPERARQFWKAVAEDNGLKIGEPEKALVNYLTGVSDGDGTALMLAAGAAWNSFYSRHSLKTIRIPKTGELRLFGTPIGSDHE